MKYAIIPHRIPNIIKEVSMTIKSYYDVVVMGGGINGCGIAADASGRGLSVLLCEKNDLASATSSMSSKLIHGGLRYLENYEFRLVRESLKERETLLKNAEHLIKPLEFVLPYHQNMRSFMLLRLGLFVYDHLYLKKSLPNSQAISLVNNPRGLMLKSDFSKALSYFDCFTHDSRLVIENALLAQKNQADIRVKHEIISVHANNNLWEIVICNRSDGQILKCQTKILVNAAGPWVNTNLLQNSLTHKFDLKLVKGSHIVVPKFYEGDFAYILQNNDQRVVFVIPYEKDYTLIGTTDCPFTDDPEHVVISEEEKDYLCKIVNQYFNITLKPDDCCWTYSGVRALLDDKNNKLSEVTRDYMLDFSLNEHGAPLLSIYGGKITTYRALAERSVNFFKNIFPDLKKPWTAHAKLPGSELERITFSEFSQKIYQQYSFLAKNLLERYLSLYGTRTQLLLSNINSEKDLGLYFNHGLYEHEIKFLIEHEWVSRVDDLLWRRTKLGLKFNSEEIEKVLQYFEAIGLPQK